MINQRNKFAAIILVALFLGGCTTAKVSIEDLASIDKKTDVVMVGRIEIIPKMEKEEVSLKMMFGGDELHQYFGMRIQNDIGDTTDYTTDTDNMAMVKTETDFYLQSSRNEPFKFYGGWFYTKIHGGGAPARSTVFFHITDGVQVEIPKNAGAVYLGVVKFKRDEFFNLKDVDIVQDDFEAAQKRFRKKFKTNMPLVKAKVTRVKK